MTKNYYKYSSCGEYALQGNQMINELYERLFKGKTMYITEPDDVHSTWDIAHYLPEDRIHVWTEVKMKFNYQVFDNYLIIEKDKIDKIKEFMKDKDINIHKFLYACYYCTQGIWVIFNINRYDYDTFEVETRNSTASLTDVKPYLKDKKFCKLPMSEAHVYHIPSSVKVYFDGCYWQYGNKIEE